MFLDVQGLVVAELTLSIVSHGHGDLLDALLRDLDSLESLRGAAAIVTLNAPGDRVDVSMYPNLRIEVVENRVPAGFAANHNAAFRRCSTEWFAILNPDLRVTSDVFSTLLATAKRSSKIALVAPVVTNKDGAVEDSVRANLTPLSIVRRALVGRRTSPVSPDQRGFRWYAGMCLLVNAAAFRAVGGFDERYFLYCEDYDLCARLHLWGYSLQLDRSSTVIHDARRSSHRSLKHFGWHVESLVRVWLSSPVWKIAIERTGA